MKLKFNPREGVSYYMGLEKGVFYVEVVDIISGNNINTGSEWFWGGTNRNLST